MPVDVSDGCAALTEDIVSTASGIRVKHVCHLSD